MARTEDNQESSNAKTLLIDDAVNGDDAAFQESELYFVLSTVFCLSAILLTVKLSMTHFYR